MNDRTAGAILLVIGVVAMFAAIVGGGIKIQQIEVGSVQSKWRQWLLGAFGLIIGAVGLIMVLPEDKAANNLVENTEVVDDNAAITDDNAGVAAADNAAASGEESADANGLDSADANVEENGGEEDTNQTQ